MIKKNFYRLALVSSLIIVQSTIFTNTLKGQIIPDKVNEPSYQWPKDPKVSEALHNWQDWKFGVIIHWGAYSQWGILESWSLCPEDEPWCIRRGPHSNDYYGYTQAYKEIRKEFNPGNFNPEKWAKACAAAGMKYVVFTTKHHDGFCMFDTKYTDYKITSPASAFSQNPRSNVVKEVFNAFRAQEMGIGAYFSKPDWSNPDYWWPYFPVFDRNVNYDPEKYADKWTNFVQYTHHQIEELMTGYGNIDILWLDGGWVRPDGSLTEETRPWLGKNQWIQDVDIPTLAQMARKHQPGLIIVDRTVHGEFENYQTPEQQIPNIKPDYPWESCITLGDSWYSTGPAENYKSVDWAIHTLIKIVSKGGNFLLGIGPDKSGDLTPEVYQRLEGIARWMEVNSQAIYNTIPLAPYHQEEFCFTSSKDGKTNYAFYMKAESKKLEAKISLPEGFIGNEKKIGLLGYDKKLSVNKINGQPTVVLPEKILRQMADSPSLVFFINN